MTINPTHTCFDDAIQTLILIMKTRPSGRLDVASGKIRIVHAVICPDGKDLPHAWVEIDSVIFFHGILNNERVAVKADRLEFEQKSKIKVIVRYTLFEAYEEERRTGHFGPWDERVRSLCGDVTSEPTKTTTPGQ